MGRYRKVDSRIWNDAKFSALSNDGKLVFLFLLTHPHMTSLGAMRASLPGLASELGWTEKAFREAFGKAFGKGLVEHDESVCFVGLPNFLKYNGPESPNVVKSWVDSLDLIPECAHKAKLLHRVKGFVQGLGKGFREALPEAFRKGMPYPEPEQEPEQEPEPEPEPEQEEEPPVVPQGGRSRLDRPSLDEVKTYCRERGNSVDPQQWFDHYTANGWKVGKNPMRDWQAAVRTWEKTSHGTNGTAATSRRAQALDFELDPT